MLMKEKMGRSRWEILIILCYFMQLGSAYFSCTVTQHSDQTTYTIISDVPLKSAAKACHCDYTWANASEHMMAHNNEKAPELVLTNNISTLTTSRCIDKVIYTRICDSEGEHYTVNCSISCSGSALRDKDKDKVFNLHPIASIAIVLVVVVVTVGLLGFLCYKFRNRVPSSGQGETSYHVV